MSFTITQLNSGTPTVPDNAAVFEFETTVAAALGSYQCTKAGLFTAATGESVTLKNSGSTVTLDVGATITAKVVQGTPFVIAAGLTPAAGLIGANDYLVVAGQVATTNLKVLSANDAATSRGVLAGVRSRGTLASPTAVVSGDTLFSFLVQGYDGAALMAPATIDFVADATVSSGHVPTKISFVTGTVSGDRTERLAISSAGVVTCKGVLSVAAGLSTAFAKAGGAIFDHYADASTSHTDGTEDTLYTDTVAASTLGANGDKLDAEYGGSFVSSATATRRLKLYFGGTAIFDSGALTLSLSSAWTVYATLIRVSATVVRYMVTLTTEGAALAAYTAAGELTGLTLSGTNVVKVTGIATGVGAASADIVATLGSVGWRSAA